jgi:hypothetical protein
MFTPLPTPREPLSRRALASRLVPGVRVAGYVVGEPLGAGGMAQVYSALDERLHRTVALKVLSDDAADDEGRARFLREARALARIEHHNVVRVHASGDDDGVVWMALEVVHGESLAALCDGQPLDEETAVGLCAQVAHGLSAVHAMGVVHRDVKPSNVLVDDDANVKLIDFGVAHVTDGAERRGGFTTRAGVVVGTPHFMSPEQARGAVVDARSDAWGLGATLYALLAGRPPFFGSDDESDLDILARVVRDDIADIRTIAPTTSAGTAALLQQLLHRDAAQRPELHSVATTLDDIAATLASGDLPAAPATAVTAPNVAVVDQASAVDVVEPVVEPAVEPAVAGLSSGLLLFVGLNVVVAIAAALVLVRWYFAEPTVVERVVERVVEVPAKPVVTTPPPIVVDLTPPTPPAPTPAPDVPTPIEALPLPALVADTSTAAGERLFSIAVSADTLGDDVVNAVADSARTDIDAILEGAIRSTHSPRRRQLAAVELLRQRRNDRALSVLMSVANAHPDSAVRRAAGEARDSIFKVE